MGITNEMTQQPYPLSCIDAGGKRYFVIGWTTSDLPVVVRESYDRTDVTGHQPVTLEGPVRFVAANMVVSVDGEVSAQIDGQVSATVAGIGRDDSVRVSVQTRP
jgi:hypothetical protein